MGDEQEPKGREQLGGFVCPLSQDRKTARGGPHGGVGMSRGQGSSDGGCADKELAIMIEKLLMLRALKIEQKCKYTEDNGRQVFPCQRSDRGKAGKNTAMLDCN